MIKYALLILSLAFAQNVWSFGDGSQSSPSQDEEQYFKGYGINTMSGCNPPVFRRSAVAACSDAVAICSPNNNPVKWVDGSTVGEYTQGQSTSGCLNKNGALLVNLIVQNFRCAAGQHFDDASQACVCPSGSTFNVTTQQCDLDPCDGSMSHNPTTGVCENCPSGSYTTEASAEWGLAAGACLPDPSECQGPNDMVIIDQSLGSTGGEPTYVGCVDGPPLGCTQTSGKLNYSEYNELDLCTEQEAACEAEGGTYGVIGDGTSISQTCIMNAGTGLPTCASGSAYSYEDSGSGSYGFACLPTTPPNDLCDAQLYDCDDDGNVDDQDGDGCVDNGTTNDFVTCTASLVPGGSGSGGTGTGGSNVGDNPLDPAVEGAGDCDPTSQNYAECIGATGGGELLEYLRGDSSGNTTSPSTTTVAESTTESMRVLSSAPIVEAISGLGNVFQGAGACPTPGFEAFGQTFTFNLHCTLYESIAGILSAAFMIFWTIAGIRHIASA